MREGITERIMPNVKEYQIKIIQMCREDLICQVR